MPVESAQSSFDVSAFLQACDTEEKIRRHVLEDAQRSYKVFSRKKFGVTAMRRMTFHEDCIPHKRMYRNRQRLIERKGLTYDPDDNEDHLTAIEHLLCESFFFGSRWHRNCHETLHAHWRNTPEDAPPMSHRDPPRITETDLSKSYSAPELCYMFMRYFPNPDFGGKQSRWTHWRSRVVENQVTEYLQSVYGISAKMSINENYTRLSPFDWENIGRSVERSGFACYQHCKHRFMNGLRSGSLALEHQKALVEITRAKGFVSDGSWQSTSCEPSERTFLHVWKSIATAVSTSLTPWQCFAEFQRIVMEQAIHRGTRQTLKRIVSLAPSRGQRSRATTLRVTPFLPFEDKLILDAHASGVMDFTALAIAMRVIPREPKNIRKRYKELIGETVSRPVLRTKRDRVRMNLLKHVYGVDAPCLAPLHFFTKRRKVEQEECLSEDLAVDQPIQIENTTEELFIPLTRSLPSRSFECAMPRAFCSPGERLSALPESKLVPVDGDRSNDSTFFEPSCCTLHGVFIPALPENFSPNVVAYQRLCSHLNADELLSDIESLQKTVLRGPEGRASLQAIIALFGNTLAGSV